mmetsp:Transcript_51630/g.82478  ORF Transcript_51630/g.82478 Transcript_51630/m.82478 type:complete len:269 (+) Transcript_51630:183-989(+)
MPYSKGLARVILLVLLYALSEICVFSSNQMDLLRRFRRGTICISSCCCSSLPSGPSGPSSPSGPSGASSASGPASASAASGSMAMSRSSRSFSVSGRTRSCKISETSSATFWGSKSIFICIAASDVDTSGAALSRKSIGGRSLHSSPWRMAATSSAAATASRAKASACWAAFSAARAWEAPKPSPSVVDNNDLAGDGPGEDAPSKKSSGGTSAAEPSLSTSISVSGSASCPTSSVSGIGGDAGGSVPLSSKTASTICKADCPTAAMDA